MLEGGADSLGLDAAHQLGGQGPGENRVLGEVLEVASAQRGAFHIDARAKED